MLQLKELNESIVQSMHDGILLTDPQGRVTFVNPALASLAGRPADALVGRCWLDCVPPDRRLVAQSADERRVSGTSDRYELELLRPDDTRLPVLVGGAPRYNPQTGQFLGTIGVFTDIGAHKRDERRRLQEFAYRNAIIEHLTEGLCVCHATAAFPFLAFTVWNERMTEITGYSMEQINRLGWYQSLYPDPEVRARAIERIKQMRMGDDLHAEQWEIAHADGGTRVIHISSAIVPSDDNAVHVLALMRDISEQRRAEQALRESEEKYRRVFENELMAVSIYDFESLRFIDVNDAFVRIYGYSRAELLAGMTTHDITVEHGASDADYQSADAHGTMHVPLRYHGKKDGTVFPVEIIGGPYALAGG